MVSRNGPIKTIFIFVTLILFCFSGLSGPNKTAKRPDPSWAKWGYDSEGTHYYPFSSRLSVDVNDFNVLWSKPGHYWGIRTTDFDLNGNLEIVISADQCVKAFNHNGALRAQAKNKGDMVTLADVSRDGLPDIIISNDQSTPNQGGINVYDSFGGRLDSYTVPVAHDGKLLYCIAGDLDKDGRAEVAVDVWAGNSAGIRGVYMIEAGSGAVEWFYSVGPAGWSCKGDLDEDGKIEFIFGGVSSHDGGYGDGVANTATPTTDDDIYTIVFNGDGGSETFTLDYFSDGESDGYTGHAIVDLDKDGNKNILVFEGHSGAYPGTLQVHLIDDSGSVLKTWNGPQITSGDHLGASWAVGDMNKDGLCEIVFCFQNYDKVWLLDHNLTEITSRVFGHALHDSESYFVINDINGDRYNEIIVKDFNAGKVVIMDKDLDVLLSKPVSTGAADLAISDINNDGTNEILVGGIQFHVLAIIPATTHESTISLHPETLNLKSKGKWITCYIELPENFDVDDIDPGSATIIQIDGREINIPAQAWPYGVGDFDDDGIPDLMVKFSRKTLIQTVKELYGDILKEFLGEVEFRVSCEINGDRFEGVDTIRIKKK